MSPHPFSHSAEKRMQKLARAAADDFETPPVHNLVHEQVSGQWNRDNDLMRLLDLAERGYALAEDLDTDAISDNVFDAAETLNEQVDRLVDEQVATACAKIVTESDDWDDAWDEEILELARDEADHWLRFHVGAAQRAGVWEEVAADA